MEAKGQRGRSGFPCILVVAYALVAGGGETFPIFLANGLRRRGHAVAVVNFGAELTVPGIRGLLNSDVPLYHLIHELDFAPLCKEIGVDVVHSSHTATDMMVAKQLPKLPKEKRPKHVVTLHGCYETIPICDILRDVLPVLAGVDHFTYAARKNLGSFPDRFLSEFGKKFTLIENALPEIEPTRPHARRELGIPEDAVVAIMIARAIWGKGWDVAMAAVQRARIELGTNIHLVLIGDGPLYDDLVGNGTEDWIHPLGFRADIRSWLSLANLGLLPTRFSGESFPLVLIDFLKMGLPVVASDAGEIPAMMHTEGGMAGSVVAIDSEGSFANSFEDALVTFLGELSGRAGFWRARALDAASKFDFEEMLSKYEKMYFDVTEFSSPTVGPMAEA